MNNNNKKPENHCTVKKVFIDPTFEEMVIASEDMQDIRRKKVFGFAKKFKWRLIFGDIILALRYEWKRESTDENKVVTTRRITGSKLFCVDETFLVNEPELMYWIPRIEQLIDYLTNYQISKAGNLHFVKVTGKLGEKIFTNEIFEVSLLKAAHYVMFNKFWDSKEKKWTEEYITEGIIEEKQEK